MRLSGDALEAVLKKYFQMSDTIAWDRYAMFSDLPSTLAPRLTPLQLEAVKTAFLVEDHIPGYCSEYSRLFPIDASCPPEQIARNRQILHFVFRWCSEEDRHAHILELYLKKTGQVDPAELEKEMIREGVKPYKAPHDDPFQLFTYTVLQERATQIFYQSLARSITDPLLQEILRKIAQDEARHCFFFTEIMKQEISARSTSAIPLLQDTLARFHMPLANMLENYKRRSIQMMRAASGYDYRQAFDYFQKVIKNYAEAATAPTQALWQEFLLALPTIP